MEPAFVRVLDVVEVMPDRELNVAACDDLAAPNRVPTQAAWFRGAMQEIQNQ